MQDDTMIQRLITSWWQIFRNQRLTVRDVLMTALEGGATTQELRSILMSIAPSDYPGAYSPQKLGRWLTRIGGQRIQISTGIYTFIHHGRGGTAGSRVWQLIPLQFTDNSISIYGSAADMLPPEFLDAAS